MKTATTKGRDETEKLGRRFGGRLSEGAIVVLTGPLGVGKTVFARGIATACGVREPITSPSFTLVHEYRAQRTFIHIDLYRIACERDFENLALDEVIFSDAVTVIEWGEKAPATVRRSAYTVTLAFGTEDSRRITIQDPS